MKTAWSKAFINTCLASQIVYNCRIRKRNEQRHLSADGDSHGSSIRAVFFFLFLLDTFLMQTKEKEMKDQVKSNLQTFARQPRSHTKVPLLKLPVGSQRTTQMSMASSGMARNNVSTPGQVTLQNPETYCTRLSGQAPWTWHTDTLFPKARQRMYFLHRWGRHNCLRSFWSTTTVQ